MTVDGKDIQLIGDVILKDKTKAYSKDAKATHYHQGKTRQLGAVDILISTVYVD